MHIVLYLIMSIARYEAQESTVPINPHSFKYLAESKFEQDWQSTPHSHSFIEFTYIDSGKGIFLSQKNMW